jgi:sensor histidine kinase YesM
MKQDLGKSSRARLLARRLPIDLAIGTVFNVIIALCLTYVMHISDSLWQNLVFAMCIGTLALLFIDGGRMIMWGAGLPPKLPFFALVVVSVPVAKYLGNELSAAILGLPTESVTTRQLTRNATEMLILTIIVSVLITWFFWTRSEVATLKAKAETEMARAAAVEKQAMQAQLQLLQAQIEPHMLFNTLANLQGLIALDAPRAQHMLDQLIQYLRATLSSSRAEKTTLSQEFALMEAYLGLMSVRMGARLSYTLQLPDPLRQITVPPMLLQPLVENAIKHGLEPKIGGGRIDVAASERDGMLVLMVADTGLGLDAPHHPGDAIQSSQSPQSTKVGLANLRERLHALYGEHGSLSLEPNTPSGVIARLTVPLQS